jgi:hypothetical protein
MTTPIADDLDATVRTAVQWLRPLEPSLVSYRPSPDRWTIKQVIGHLIDSAANNHQRFVRAQFTDKLIFPKYEQNDWVRCQFYDDAEWEDLVGLWEHYNRHLVRIIRKIPATALDVVCVIGDYEPATLGFLIEDYVVHLKHHLAKIDERVKAGARQ